MKPFLRFFALFVLTFPFVANAQTSYAYIEDDTAYLWGEPLNNSQVVLHFPKALESMASYSDEDLATFNVDDTMYISNNAILKLGNYPVSHTETDLSVVVDVEIVE